MEVLVSPMEKEVPCRNLSELDTCLSRRSSVLTQESEEKEGERWREAEIKEPGREQFERMKKKDKCQHESDSVRAEANLSGENLMRHSFSIFW